MMTTTEREHREQAEDTLDTVLELDWLVAEYLFGDLPNFWEDEQEIPDPAEVGRELFEGGRR